MIRFSLRRIFILINNPIVNVGFLTILGLFLRRYHLAARSLWVDEAMLFHISRGNFWEILFKNATMSSAPPLYPFLLRGIQVLGDSEIVLRGFSMAAGALAIPLLYFLFRKWLSKWAAWLATALFTIAASQISYSQQVREYSLTVLFSIGMILTAWNYVEKPGWRNLVILTIVWVVGIWLQFGLSVLGLSLNLVFLACWIKHRDLRTLFQWAVGQVLPLISVLLIYILALRYQYIAGGSGIQYLAQGYWDPATRTLGTFILDQTLDLIHFTFADVNFFPILLVIGLASTLMYKGRHSVLIWVFIPIGLTLILGLLRIYPYLGTRHDIFLTPLVFLLCGRGIDDLCKSDPKKILVSIMIVAVMIPNFQSVLDYYQSPGAENSRPAIKLIKENLQPGDRIYVYYAAEFAFRYYYREQANPVVIGKGHRGNTDLYFAELDPLIHTPGRIWMLFTHCYQNECEQIRDHLQASRPVELVQSGSQLFLYLAP